jgi:hypothetical protein
LQSNNLEHIQIDRTKYVVDKYAISLGYATTQRKMTNLGMKAMFNHPFSFEDKQWGSLSLQLLYGAV